MSNFLIVKNIKNNFLWKTNVSFINKFIHYMFRRSINHLQARK